MELVLLLPEKKPPFIGVLIDDPNEAASLNQDLILEHKQRSYKIVLEVMKGHVNLRLICEELVTVRFYNHLKYDPEQLKSWLYVISANQTPLVMFSQLIKLSIGLQPVKTRDRGQTFKLRVVNCTMFTPYSKEIGTIMKNTKGGSWDQL